MVAEEPLLEELGGLYLELSNQRAMHFQSVVSELGLSVSQARTLMLIDPESAMTMRQVAQAAMLEPSNLTGVIDKLEARRLVKRSLDPGDRRVKMVSITRLGATRRAQLLERSGEPAPWMLALSPRDQYQLLLILRKAISGAPAADPEPAFAPSGVSPR